MNKNYIPRSFYGVLEKIKGNKKTELAIEEIMARGYTIINSGFTKREISQIASKFDLTRAKYLKKYKISALKEIDEYNIIRLPLALDHECFLKILSNKNLHMCIKKIIHGPYILNQQNGIINSPKNSFKRALWHRDIPYQHFVASRPLALNAIYCVDNFTKDNGSIFVLPGSHKFEKLNSKKYIYNNALQIEARAGSYILLDSMLYHAGGINQTSVNQRAVNQVFTIPYFNQQINIRNNLNEKLIPKKYKFLLGYFNDEYENVSSWLLNRKKRLLSESIK
jgi:hypothetical protein